LGDQTEKDMVDSISTKMRSVVMAAVKSKGNKATELKMVAVFRKHGVKGWHRHERLKGKPDFVFVRARLAVFVDGCFWHGCRQHLRIPKSNTSYWKHKIARNIARDLNTNRALRKAGWRVLRVWEHSLKKPSILARRIKSALKAGERRCMDGCT
jgi:DNA mismatch endonuclease (patch repair protein)